MKRVLIRRSNQWQPNGIYVVSDDNASPTPVKLNRSNSPLAESQSTPKVSQIKAKPTTPRRASSRHNKSTMLSDIIDE